MLKQELIHSHILVAIFCGWIPMKPNKEYPNGWLTLKETDEDNHDLDGIPKDEVHVVSNDAILEELPYQTDWNYLMAASQRLSESIDEMDKEELQEHPEIIDIEKNIKDAILKYDNDLAFKELVRGINYINQLKLQET